MKSKITLKIEGMHCASCEIITKEELSELPGVSDIVIDSKEGKGELILDSEKNSKDDILTAIKNAGYDASIISEISSEPEEIKKEKEITVIKKETKKRKSYQDETRSKNRG